MHAWYQVGLFSQKIKYRLLSFLWHNYKRKIKWWAKVTRIIVKVIVFIFQQGKKNYLKSWCLNIASYHVMRIKTVKLNRGDEQCQAFGHPTDKVNRKIIAGCKCNGQLSPRKLNPQIAIKTLWPSNTRCLCHFFVTYLLLNCLIN